MPERRRPTRDSILDFERGAAALGSAALDLRLYVAGNTAASVHALAVITDLCERYAAGRFSLEVVDVFHHPDRARADQILAIPTLLRLAPPPLRRLVGDMRDEDVVLGALGIHPQPSAADGDEANPPDKTPA